MSRTVAVRNNYQADVAYLSRLAQAINIDPKRKEAWKKKVMRDINMVIMHLVNADYGKGSLK